MSVEATAAMWARRDLTSTEKLVAVRLADHARPDGGNACPSVRRLCEDTGLKPRTVQYALRGLEEKGVIRSEGIHEKYRTNVYRLDLTPAPAAPRTECTPPQDTTPEGASDDCTPPHLTAVEGAPAAPESLVTVRDQPSSTAADDAVLVEALRITDLRIAAGDKINSRAGYAVSIAEDLREQGWKPTEAEVAAVYLYPDADEILAEMREREAAPPGDHLAEARARLRTPRSEAS